MHPILRLQQFTYVNAQTILRKAAITQIAHTVAEQAQRAYRNLVHDRPTNIASVSDPLADGIAVTAVGYDLATSFKQRLQHAKNTVNKARLPMILCCILTQASRPIS